MKKYLYIILSGLAALAFAACQEEEPAYTPEVKDITVASVKDLVFLPAGGSGTIVVNCETSFTATSDKPWCTVSVSGNTVTVSASENLKNESRYATVLMKTSQSSQSVVVQQVGEVLDGLKLQDCLVSRDGTSFIYKYASNLDVVMSSDKDWVHFEMIDDIKEGKMVKVTVDENAGFGTRFATVSFEAGSLGGSCTITQEPTYGTVAGWTVEDTGGEFVFPDQKDVISVTPPSAMASTPYYWGVVDPSELVGVDVPALIKEGADELMAAAKAGQVTFVKGSASEEFLNLPSTATAIIICFDDQNYPTGQYALVDVAVPDRGPVKQQVDGWEITHPEGSYVHPTQTDQFIITPKSGYEDVKYIATAVKKESVASIDDFVFTTFAMDTRAEIMAKVKAGELPSFEAGLCSGETTLTVENMTGDLYVVVVAFGDNQFYTGDYTVVEINVPDAQPYYYKWLGNWSVSRQNSNYDVVDTWVITMKEEGSTLLIQGVEGFTNPERYDVEATVDENGNLVVKSQYTGSYQDSSRGTVNVLLSGQYTNVQGKTYYTSSVGVVLFRGNMSSDFNSAELVPGTVTSAGEPATFFNIQYYGRYTNSSGGTSAVTWNAGPTQLPQTITRIVE